MERLWTYTQTTEWHALWDVRFSSVVALPGEPGAPPRSRYVTQLAPGVSISGDVELLGVAYKPDGSRSSKIRFSSSDPKSLIRSGTGYWRYVPVRDGVRFISYFAYETRYGALGRLLDLVQRPLLRRLTVRSFAVLALQLEPPYAASTSANGPSEEIS